MLSLQKYDFDIEYVSGKKMFVSDALGRAHETNATSEIPELEIHVKSIFCRLGFPKKVISDNGPEFSSYEFSAFAKEWDFHHNPSSPRYSQSNGLVETTIQTVKKTLLKVVKEEMMFTLAY